VSGGCIIFLDIGWGWGIVGEAYLKDEEERSAGSETFLVDFGRVILGICEPDAVDRVNLGGI
jgi:hypothetical protein